MAMRDVIFDAISKGGTTKKSLLELTETTEKGLASQFTYLRMMGKCPMKQEDGTYKIVSSEEWNNRSNGSGTSSVPLTPEKRLEKMEKRLERASGVYDNAKKRAEIDANLENKLVQLKFAKAKVEFQIAEIELGQAQVIMNEVSKDDIVEDDIIEDDIVEDEVDELNFDNDEFGKDLD